jgi:predicted ATPase
LGETPQLFPVLAGLRFFYSVHGEIQTSHELGEQLLRLAQSAGDPGLMLEAHYALAIPLHLLGEFVPALEHCEQTIALYDPQRHRSHAFLYGMDAGVTSRSLAAWMLCKLGYPDRALERSREALSLAREVAHPFSLAYALVFACIIYSLRGEMQAVLESAEALIALSQEQGFSFWLAEGILLRGMALAGLGKEEAGIAGILQGIAGWQATGAQAYGTGFLAILLEAYLKRRDTDEGMRVLTEALATAENTGERHEQAHLYRLKGELLRIQDGDSEAEQSFRTSIRIARSQNAKSVELSATTSLARLLADLGRRDEGHAILAEIYGWFTEGFGTRDLKDAKALLDELGA